MVGATAAVIRLLALCPKVPLKESGCQRRTRKRQGEAIMLSCLESMRNDVSPVITCGHKGFIQVRRPEAQWTKPLW